MREVEVGTGTRRSLGVRCNWLWLCEGGYRATARQMWSRAGSACMQRKRKRKRETERERERERERVGDPACEEAARGRVGARREGQEYGE